MEKIIATQEAIRMVEILKEKYGRILFIQSSGCCDGTVPLCFEEDGYYISSQMINVGNILGVPYYIDKVQAEYLKNMQIEVDIMEGHGASFSLENAEGYSFLMRSKVISNCSK